MRKKKAFTLIELLVVVAIIALLISILLPSLSRARELSKRLVCASNVKGMGTAFKIYANDYEEHWPTVPFRAPAANSFVTWWGTDGLVGVGGGNEQNPNRAQQSTTNSTTLSVTRNMWMLVRSGDVTPKSYLCPSSGDSQANEQNVDLFYDFATYTNVSYGYQVPYGPFSTRASEDIDPRMAVAADKSPYGSGNKTDLPNGVTGWSDTAGMATPQDWRQFNSGNHGGTGSGEGQNVLFGDGHASFEKTPDVGIDQDNIFTKMAPFQANSLFITNRASGAIPANSRYPGYQTMGTSDASTDALIYP